MIIGLIVALVVSLLLPAFAFASSDSLDSIHYETKINNNGTFDIEQNLNV